MQLYNGTIRLGNSLQNEVPKFGITAAEVLILDTIHGAGTSFVGIELAKDANGLPKRFTGDPRALRDELMTKYREMIGDPPLAMGHKILSEGGFSNHLPDAVEDVAPLSHLADQLKASAATKQAIEDAAEERVKRRMEEAKALLAPVAAPERTPEEEAEVARLAGLGGKSGSTEAEFG